MKTTISAAFLALMLSVAGTGSAAAASFDCDEARTPDEIAICNDRELNDLDVKMATLFDVAKGFVLMGERGSMQDDQREWLARRRHCGSNVGCLKRSYRKRVGELEAALRDIRSRGQY